jgi:copper(I)-binding protein
VSRSTARFPSSGSRRAALLLTAGAASAALLSACGTGQISQTAQKVSAVEGVSGNVGNIDVNDALLAFPESHRYEKGSDAPVAFTVANDGLVDDKLVAAKSPDAASVVLAQPAPGSVPPALGCVIPAGVLEAVVPPGQTRPPAPAGAEKFPTAGPGSAGPEQSASAPAPTTSPSATASVPAASGESASASPAAAAPKSSTTIAVPVPHDGMTELTEGCPYLLVRGLTRELLPSDTIRLELTFARAGVLTLDVPVATPNSPLPREAVPGFAEHGAAEGGAHGEAPAAGHGASPTAGHG